MNPSQTGLNGAERQIDARAVKPLPQLADTRAARLPIVKRAENIRMRDVDPRPSSEVGMGCDCGRHRPCPFRVLCAE